MNKSELQFYQRQIKLPNFGLEGQKLLKKSSVLVIGAGGLGSAALQYLAAAGVGNIGICDFDNIDISNMHRQVIYDFVQIGLPKIEAAEKNIGRFNPNLKIQKINEKISAENIEYFISQYDVVLDCTDNFNTKFLVHDACYLNRINLVQSSIYQFEGQLQVFKFADDNNAGCFRCLWNKIPDEGCVGTCGEVGVLGVVPGIFGTLQASETIKLILGWEGLQQGKTFIFDLLTLESRTISWKRKENCPLCGKNPQIINVENSEYEKLEDYELYSDSTDVQNFVLIDVRDENECNESFLKEFNIHNIPFTTINKTLPKIELDKLYLFFCNYGIKSKDVVKRLRLAGFKNTFSLKDGISGIKKMLNC